jgi:hypothetical protein
MDGLAIANLRCCSIEVSEAATFVSKWVGSIMMPFGTDPYLNLQPILWSCPLQQYSSLYRLILEVT